MSVMHVKFRQCVHSSHINSRLSLLSGEWEISAFDGRLKSRGMSIRYSVRPCDNGDLLLVDHDRDEDDISDYIDLLEPRSRRPQNRTVLVKVCTKPLANNSTQSGNSPRQNIPNDKAEGTGAAEGQSICQLKRVPVTSLGGEKPNKVSEGGIPQDILEELERDGEWTVTENGTEPGEKRSVRQRRQAEGNWSSGALEDGGIEFGGEAVENRNNNGAEIKSEERRDMPHEMNRTKEEPEESNEILLNSDPLLTKNISTVEPSTSEEMDGNFVTQKHIQSERERLTVDLLDLEYNYNLDNNNATEIDLSLEYDDYSQQVLFSLCLVYIYYVRNPSPTVMQTLFHRLTAHQIYLAQITCSHAPQGTDFPLTTLLQKRSPGTMVSKNRISSSNPGRNNISSRIRAGL